MVNPPGSRPSPGAPGVDAGGEGSASICRRVSSFTAASPGPHVVHPGASVALRCVPCSQSRSNREMHAESHALEGVRECQVS